MSENIENLVESRKFKMRVGERFSTDRIRIELKTISRSATQTNDPKLLEILNKNVSAATIEVFIGDYTEPSELQIKFLHTLDLTKEINIKLVSISHHEEEVEFELIKNPLNSTEKLPNLPEEN